MRESMLGFSEQFLFKPEIQNRGQLIRNKQIILAGMGGSNLAGGLLKIFRPDFDIIFHRNYGLPAISSKKIKNYLLIASSYSGNTEETISSLREAIKRKIPAAVVTQGGYLLKIAQTKKIPYIKLPETGIQPRQALGYSFRSFLDIVGDNKMLSETEELYNKIKTKSADLRGKKLAKKIKGKIPIIYSSENLIPLNYIWKIKFNETSKTPSFSNFFPELNHNEMTGFDFAKSFPLNKFVFLILRTKNDFPQIKKRMDVFTRMFEKRGFTVLTLDIGERNLSGIFNSIVLADWTTYNLALIYKHDPENVPMVEEFKKEIKNETTF